MRVSSYLSVSSAVARLSTLLALSISARSLFRAATQSAWNGIWELSAVVLSSLMPLSISRYRTSSVVRVRSLIEWPTSSSQDDWPSIWELQTSARHYLQCVLWLYQRQSTRTTHICPSLSLSLLSERSKWQRYCFHSMCVCVCLCAADQSIRPV